MRNAARDPRHRGHERRELPTEQKRRSLAVHARGGCNDDFLDAVVSYAVHEASERQILRPDAFERSQELAEDEVTPAHDAGALDGQEIMDARDDAQDRSIALGVTAHVAETMAVGQVRHVAALRARSELVPERRQLCPEAPGERFVGGQEPKDVAMGGLLTDSRKSGKKLNQIENLGAHGRKAGKSKGSSWSSKNN